MALFSIGGQDTTLVAATAKLIGLVYSMCTRNSQNGLGCWQKFISELRLLEVSQLSVLIFVGNSSSTLAMLAGSVAATALPVIPFSLHICNF